MRTIRPTESSWAEYGGKVTVGSIGRFWLLAKMQDLSHSAHVHTQHGNIEKTIWTTIRREAMITANKHWRFARIILAARTARSQGRLCPRRDAERRVIKRQPGNWSSPLYPDIAPPWDIIGMDGPACWLAWVARL